jgi:hypothetical protein
VIAKAARKGTVVRSSYEARLLASKHPDSGMTLADITAEIVKLAGERGLPVDPSE